MDCKSFRELLPRYLGGNLAEPDFGRMVEHEAACPGCHRLASERMPESSVKDPGTSWLGETLQRTIGSDCRYIEKRLAEAMDSPPDPDTARLVTGHLARCPSCRALAGVMRELPAFYRAFPRLRADRSFVGRILERTSRPRAVRIPSMGTQQTRWRRVGFLDVLRALWRRPEAVWEGAVVCALMITPFAGQWTVHWFHEAQRTCRTAPQQAGIADLRASLDAGIADLHASLDKEVATTGRRIAALPSAKADAARQEWAKVRTWAQEALDAATPEIPAGSPPATAQSWAERALSRIGLMERAPDRPCDETPPGEPRDLDHPEPAHLPGASDLEESGAPNVEESESSRPGSQPEGKESDGRRFQ